jgi:hypothetical protein
MPISTLESVSTLTWTRNGSGRGICGESCLKTSGECKLGWISSASSLDEVWTSHRVPSLDRNMTNPADWPSSIIDVDSAYTEDSALPEADIPVDILGSEPVDGLSVSGPREKVPHLSRPQCLHSRSGDSEFVLEVWTSCLH